MKIRNIFKFNHKTRKEVLQEMIRNAIMRQNPFYHRNVAINHEKTNMRVIKIKKNNYDHMVGLKQIPSNVAFLFEHTSVIDLTEFTCDYDLVGTDYAGVVLKLITKKQVNQQIDWTNDNIKNIWVLPSNVIRNYDLVYGNLINTKIYKV